MDRNFMSPNFLSSSFEKLKCFPIKLLYSGNNEVWKGFRGEEVVAIKVCDYGGKSEIINNEIRINEYLKYKHENIITMLDYQIDKDVSVLIFEYAKFHTVMDLINKKKESGLPLLIIYCIFSQIVEGVKFLHSKKIAHRDLKNENFLIAENGSIKLCDFEISIDLSGDDYAKKETILNIFNHLTKEYRLPKIKESADLNNINWFSYDIWCIGIALYELLEGKIPFIIETEKGFIIKENLKLSDKGINNNITSLILCNIL
jgi:serine/threonine protein kinase